MVEKNFYNHDLSDTRLDLVVHNWTRFDHRRNFTCKIEHPAYQGLVKELNHSIDVLCKLVVCCVKFRFSIYFCLLQVGHH